MPYIGKEPIVGNYVLLDSIVTSATDTYAMLKNGVAYRPESARNMIVSLNGITQAPETAYSVSGSNLIFSQVLSASDVIDYVLVLGDVLDIGVPSDNSVGESQLQYPLTNFSSTGIDDNATSTAITVDSSQNVGIGTDIPNRTLTVSSASGVPAELISSSTNSLLAFFDSGTGVRPSVGSAGSDLVANVNSSERLRITDTGNVGIGTDAPVKSLAVSDGGGFGVELSPDDGGQGFNRIINYDRVGNVYVPVRHEGSTHKFIAGAAGAVDALNIDSTGNVGIGETSPDSLLHIKGTSLTAKQTIESNSFNNVCEIYAGDGSLNFRANVTGVLGASFRFMSFGVGSGEDMRIDASGNVGIGTTDTSGTKLAVQDGAGVRTFMDSTATWGSIGVVGANPLAFFSNASERMRIDANGNLLVGKTAAAGLSSTGIEMNPDGVLYVSYNGTAPAAHFNRGNNGSGLIFQVGTVDAGGVTFTQSGTPAFFSASDERLKDNIVDHESELANVMALRPTRWDWKDEAKGSGEGFIAQELEQTAWADLVRDGEDGFKVVDGLGTVETRLIKALQEAVGRIESLEAEVKFLREGV